MLLRIEGSVRFPCLWGERMKRWRNYLLRVSINVNRLQSKEKSHRTRLRTTAPLLSLQKGSLTILKREQRCLEWCLSDQCQQYPRDGTSSFHRVHRMAHVGRQLWRLPARPMLLKQGHPAQVAQGHAQMASEDLQGGSWLLTFVATIQPLSLLWAFLSPVPRRESHWPFSPSTPLHSSLQPSPRAACPNICTLEDGRGVRRQGARNEHPCLPAWHHDTLPTTLLTLQAAATLWFRTEGVQGCQQRQPDVAALCAANINPS